ncbi:hypothetical protein [Solibacillus sp. FSL K6-1523]|uniref:hypothetical protein n=1 Tax=Solibacillus sp. FSL K6-1523 TaxID=2921471 RepID=UPI0030FB6B49
MAQVGTSKEISGKKMGFIVIGTIIAATIAIVIAIQAFYMTWDPKQKKDQQNDETNEPSYTKSAMHQYEQLLKIS